MKPPKMFEISPDVFFTHYRKPRFNPQTVKEDPRLTFELLPNGSSQILQNLSTIGKWLLIVPPDQNVGKPGLLLHLFRCFHKVACGIATVLTTTLMAFTVFSMCRGTINQLSSDPSGIFICFELVSFLYLVVATYTTGRNLSQKLEPVFQNRSQNLGYNEPILNWGKLVLSPLSVWVLASILYMANRTAEFADSAFTTHGYYTKFSGRFEKHVSFLLGEETKKYLKYTFFKIICTVAYASPRIVRMYGAIMVFTGIILYSCAVREFTGCIKQFGSVAEFRLQFGTFQRQVEALNKLMGRVVLGFVCYLVTMYTTWIIDLFYDSGKEEKIRDKVTFLIDFVLYSTFFGMAANYQIVVSTVEDTILRNREAWKLDSGEFTSFLYRARYCELGVSGGGFFTITHKCIASVLSSMLTYTIVLLQLKPARSG